MDHTAADLKLQELETMQPAKLLIASTAEVKNFSPEKVRLLKQHETRMRTLEEKGEEASSAFKKYVQGNDEAIEQERQRRQIYLEGIETQYKPFK